MSVDRPPPAGPRWARVQTVALLAAAAGAVAFVVLPFTPVVGPHALARAATAYLVAFHFCLAIPLGCLVVLMMQYLTGGAWGVLLRPVLEQGLGTLWLVGLMFLPVAGSMFLGAESPYPWARPLDQVATGSVLDELREKTWLLNPWFVLGRAVVYFAIWLFMAYRLPASAAEWRAGDESAGRRLVAHSGPGLIIYAVTVTFASIDWVMSLEPFWRSTIYPPIYALGQVIAGLATAIATVVLLSPFPPLAGRVTPKLRRDLGGLLLAFVMIWAYCAFSQFLLVWVGNLPEEAPYYLKRMRGGWEWIGVALIVLHFAAPFVLLLFRDVKETAPSLLWVALGLLAMRAVDVFWWIEAAFPHGREPVFWLEDGAAVMALGGLWLWWYVGALSRAPLDPAHGVGQCEPEEARA